MENHRIAVGDISLESGGGPDSENTAVFTLWRREHEISRRVHRPRAGSGPSKIENLHNPRIVKIENRRISVSDISLESDCSQIQELQQFLHYDFGNEKYRGKAIAPEDLLTAEENWKFAQTRVVKMDKRESQISVGDISSESGGGPDAGNLKVFITGRRDARYYENPPPAGRVKIEK